ncbi:hypothetical protein [Microvirga arsenatis]|uniref:Nucleotide pyrophosphohydrolase n=1 Tax=Microvirga arsenatis TaxID=2692265 RepID=A0ABW9YXL1_9HYPH|nr:hypothetical protein [Microvirga arsenatis]NBJ13243.1 hypothetical protein [Microvirga arsenatis]NBJ25119.1 hypothetical protein [Microvirga arsenatis]
MSDLSIEALRTENMRLREENKRLTTQARVFETEVNDLKTLDTHAEWQRLDKLLAEAEAAASMVSYLRPEVLAFALLMEQQLRANDHKPGWKNDAPVVLMDRLHEEAAELHEALKQGDYREHIALEAADVANFAMMIADVCGCLGEKP